METRQYTPTNSVWEITYACNMRCKHCGSGCGTRYPDELSTAEALALCDDLAELGMRLVTLSGGEPFLHPDWDSLARRLTERGVTVNAISNGWFIDEELVGKAREAGLVNIGVSLDGLEQTHDFIRKPGAFGHVMEALEVMNRHQMPTVVCTSVNKRNLSELAAMKELLYEKKVQRWQFQIASPMGNLLDHPELLCEMQEADRLIGFAYDVMQEGRLLVDLADDIGYFNLKENEVRKKSYYLNKAVVVWRGCQAGKCVMGIRANGDISGCLSIRDEHFIEGNVREKPLKEIWHGKGAFAWNRTLTKDKLAGFCGKCQYANYCLGGCTGLKLTFSGSIYTNKFCSFRLAIEKETRRIGRIKNLRQLNEKADQAIADKEYQIAELYLARIHSLKPEDPRTLERLGFVNYFLENYRAARSYNVMNLELDPENAYAHKGLGLCLVAMGEVPEGINHLRKAIRFASPEFTDPYFDLAVVLDRIGRSREALDVLDAGRRLSARFIEQSAAFYKQLLEKTTLD